VHLRVLGDRSNPFRMPTFDRAAVSVDRRYQSTESVPSPCGFGAISSSVRRSMTWMIPRSFFAGQTSAARTFSSSSSSPR